MSTIAAVLVRKSNEEGEGSNADVKSISVQREACVRFAESRGWTIDEKYVFADDAVSGATFDRPGLKALLAAAASSPAPFTKLVVTEQSRIGRDTVGTIVVVQKLEDAGIEIWSVADNRQITLADESNEIMTLLGAWRDKAERRKTITRVRRAAFNNHEKGYVAGGTVYGYRNERLPGAGKQPVRRVVNDEQAGIVRRIFEMARDGYGLVRIAKALNAEGVHAPRAKWEATGVREVLRRDLYRGIEVFGRVKRTGPKSRVRLPESEWKRRECPELRIVSDELWTAAHARMAENSAQFLRKSGKLVGQRESANHHLFAGFLACGICNGTLVATTRGKANLAAYICRNHRLRGDCENTTAVPMDRLHATVIASIEETFSLEHFERLLKSKAEDEQARASREAERTALLARIPVLESECVRLADAVAAGSGTLDVLLAGIKSRQAEREQAEHRLAVIEADARALREQAGAVETFRQRWGDWKGALKAEPVLARQLLRKILVGPILVLPKGPRAWEFLGGSRYDAILNGGLTPSQDFYRAWSPEERARMIAGLRAKFPAGVALGPTAWTSPSIAGGCDDSHDVSASEMAPKPPNVRRAPAEPWRSSVRREGGGPEMAPNPPMLVAPRRSRGAPRYCASAGPRQAPKPPSARRARAQGWRSSGLRECRAAAAARRSYAVQEEFGVVWEHAE
jgi:DNA invertase Pin-like site-specific DNA recombinase